MDQQGLAQRIDAIIAELLAQRQSVVPERQIMRVVVSGEDLSTLPATLDCLAALEGAGYSLALTFSHSASQSALQSACLDGLALRGVRAFATENTIMPVGDGFCGLYLPSLSTNSLCKIALGIRDNCVCHWAFHALKLRKQVIVTLNAECQPQTAELFAPGWRTRLTGYLSILTDYGIRVVKQQAAELPFLPVGNGEPRLITLSDVRRCRAGQVLQLGRRTLVTPAAWDEIRDRRLVIIRS